jgi:flagellar P-ring protein precursor FlgI
MYKKVRFCFLIALLLSNGLAATCSHAARIKDLAYFKGGRINQLIGYGLVVGLDGTGDKDQTKFTNSSLANLLDNMRIKIDPTQIKVKNVAAVMVTANFSPFLRNGSRIDCQVSSIGDAKSLQGGTLLMTPLQGPDNQIYAVAQGPIVIGGYRFSGSSGTKVEKNHPTVGLISEGAIVEREVPSQLSESRQMQLALRTPDFTTALKMAQSINSALGGGCAQALDAGTIKLEIPSHFENRTIEMIGQIENLQVQPEMVARIIVNERTGTIVMGEHVRITPVAVAHGNLTVQVTETPTVSQPLPFSQGRTVEVPDTQIEVQEAKGALRLIKGNATISQLVKGLNSIGVTPRDLISILQAIKAAGALQADLEII